MIVTQFQRLPFFFTPHSQFGVYSPPPPRPHSTMNNVAVGNIVSENSMEHACSYAPLSIVLTSSDNVPVVFFLYMLYSFCACCILLYLLSSFCTCCIRYVPVVFFLYLLYSCCTYCILVVPIVFFLYLLYSFCTCCILICLMCIVASFKFSCV